MNGGEKALRQSPHLRGLLIFPFLSLPLITLIPLLCMIRKSIPQILTHFMSYAIQDLLQCDSF